MSLSARPRVRADRGVYTILIVVIWSLVLFGFGADLARYLHEAPQPPWILDLHGAFALLWLGLVSTQVLLAENGNIRLHRKLGWVTVCVSAAMVPLGVTAAMVDMTREAAHPDYTPQFLAEEFQDIIAFALCVTAGVVTRKNRAEHACFMVLAAVALLDVGPGRIASNILAAAPSDPLGVWAEYYWGTGLILVAMLTWDLVKHRRVMRSLALGAGLLLGGEAIASMLYYNPAWKAVATGLVKAWGWAG